jgi:hypothetical protein
VDKRNKPTTLPVQKCAPSRLLLTKNRVLFDDGTTWQFDETSFSYNASLSNTTELLEPCFLDTCQKPLDISFGKFNFPIFTL